MSVLADVVFSTDGLGLAYTLRSSPDVVIEFEQVVAHGADVGPMPYFWASGCDLGSFEEAMRTDPTINEVALQDCLNGNRLYEVAWNEAVVESIQKFLERQVSIVSATARHSTWQLTLRFPTHTRLSDFHTYCREVDLDVRPRRVYSPKDSQSSRFGLTTAQEQALQCAYQNGYFEVPRQINATELADELGISVNSTSQRLRRGLHNLVEATLTYRDSLDYEFH